MKLFSKTKPPTYLRPNPLLLVIFLELGIFFLHVIRSSMPEGFDSLNYMMHQYIFLNNVMTAGEIPFWSPFLSHGSIISPLYTSSSNLLLNVLMLIGPLFKKVNFITIFHAGFFIDQLILITGTWALCKLYYKNKLTWFFVTSTVAGATFWVFNPSPDFHLYYCLPLILYFLHMLIATKRWIYLFLAANLWSLQILSNSFYLAILQSIVIFFYFVFFFIFNYHQFKKPQLKISKLLVFSLFGVMLSLSIIVLLLKHDIGSLFFNSLDRTPDGHVSLSTFLNYAANRPLLRLMDYFHGIPWQNDYLLYIGIIPLLLTLVGIFGARDQKRLHMTALIIFLFLFLQFKFFATLFYFAWPFMKYVRHLFVLDTIIKLLFCFMAGWGFEFLHDQLKIGIKEKKVRPLILGLAILLILSTVLFASITSHPELFIEGIKQKSKVFFLKELLAWLNISLGWLIVFQASLLLTLFLVRSTTKYRIIIYLLVIFNLINLYGFKLFLIKNHCVALNQASRKEWDYQLPPYRKRRSATFHEFYSNNEKKSFLDAIRILNFYATIDSFCFIDQVNSPFRLDFWLNPIEDLRQAFLKAGYTKYISVPFFKGIPEIFRFPIDHPAALKLIGNSEDKIQFFKQAFEVPPSELPLLLSNPDFQGDMLFISKEATENNTPFSTPWNSEGSLTNNDRISLDYMVTRFSNNRLELDANNPYPNPIWLFYADSFHPGWRATINARPVKIHKAFIAYKAITLFPGKNSVIFHFQSKKLTFLFWILGINSLAWIYYLIRMTCQLILQKKEL